MKGCRSLSLFRSLVNFDHFKAPQPPQIDQRQAQVDHRQPQPQLQRQPPRQPQRRPGRPTGQNRPRPQQARGRPSVGQKRPEIYRPKKQYAGTINTLKKVRLTFFEHSSRCRVIRGSISKYGPSSRYHVLTFQTKLA